MATTTAGPILVRIAVVGCPCGMIPLADAAHRTSRGAWEAAARHVEASRGACAQRVRTAWDHVPPALVPDKD